jgi:hypothetical protein
MQKGHAHLPRLSHEHYQQFAMVHWTMGFRGDAGNWLEEFSHSHVRELLLHTAVLYRLACPVYCLMPDHLHVLLVGLHVEADQRLAVAFFRRHLNSMLTTRYHARLQKQAYDNVLRERDRERGAFQKLAWYVLENPVEAGLTKDADSWPFSGCVVPGHPGWTVFHDEYWESFWKWYGEECRRGEG